MEYITLLKSNFRRHKSSFLGIVILFFVISASLCIVLSIWGNSNLYIKEEINRLGFGDITTWVSNVENIDMLTNEISNYSDVEKVDTQNIIYSNYIINEMDSDSEGQLIVYDGDNYPYKILSDNLTGYKENIITILPGEIYISPSLQSTFHVNIGDIIKFQIARNGGEKTFTVKGYYEDPFMGSTMIGMKGFLICNEDYLEISQTIQKSGINALARQGSMIHIFQGINSTLNAGEFKSLLDTDKNIQRYIEFTHSKDTILGFMILLQNILTAFLVVFALTLICVSLIVISNSISGNIEQDYVNIGILKVMGITNRILKLSQLNFYLSGILFGIISGVVVSIPLINKLVTLTITTTGLLIPSNLSVKLCSIIIVIIICLMISFIMIKTNEILKVTPLSAIRREVNRPQLNHSVKLPIKKCNLNFYLALRKVITAKRQYASVCFITILLVFFASLIGRINVWLGPDGVGMMNAFNPAEHDIGVQIIGDMGIEEVEDTIKSYTDITDTYLLAMPNIVMDGIEFTANIISEPQRFNIIDGRTCSTADEIVITEFVAKDLKLNIGDSVNISNGANNNIYTVSGIYQCANDMGNNIGMNREGFNKISREDPRMWCMHYFLEDTTKQQNVIQALENKYGGDIHVHENTWPGLYSIITAMKLITYFMYVVVGIFILVVVTLTGSKILHMEQKDLGIYKAIGFNTADLKLAFALRFTIVSIVGASLGVILSEILGDYLVATVLKIAGISSFTTKLSVFTSLLPAVVVVVLYFIFSYISARKIQKVDFSELIVE